MVENINNNQSSEGENQSPQETIVKVTEAQNSAPVSVPMENNDVKDNKLIAAICYIWIIGLVLLFIKKDSDFVQFHAKQATVLFVVSLIFSIIPFLGWALNIVIFVFAIVGFIAALQGKKTELPVIADLARKISF